MTDILEHLKTPESRAWLAMQFVLGELTDEQTAQFDAAMHNDVTLCDSVVEATRLVSGLMLAGETLAHVARPTVAIVPRHRSPLVAWVVGGSVVAAMTLGVMSALTDSRFPGDSSGSGRLVSLATAADVETANVYMELLPEDGAMEADEDNADDSDEDNADRDALNDLMAPEWLLTAVELEQQSAAESPADGGEVF